MGKSVLVADYTHTHTHAHIHPTYTPQTYTTHTRTHTYNQSVLVADLVGSKNFQVESGGDKAETGLGPSQGCTKGTECCKNSIAINDLATPVPMRMAANLRKHTVGLRDRLPAGWWITG